MDVRVPKESKSVSQNINSVFVSLHAWSFSPKWMVVLAYHDPGGMPVVKEVMAQQLNTANVHKLSILECYLTCS